MTETFIFPEAKVEIATTPKCRAGASSETESKGSFLSATGPTGCISAIDDRRPYRGSECFCGVEDWNGRCKEPGWQTYGGQWQVYESDYCVGCTAAKTSHRQKCFKSNYLTGDADKDLQTQMDCCRNLYTDDKAAQVCDPTWCSGSPSCRAVYSQWCSKENNITSDICQRLNQPAPTGDQVLYNEILSDYCIRNNTDGSKFKQGVCQTYCKSSDGIKSNCGAKLDTICATKKPDDANWSYICGCHYPDSVYSTFTADLAAKWNVPATAVGGPRTCKFPLCQSANEAFQPSSPKDCPETSIVTCLQNVSVDATGAVLKNSAINVKQDTACKAAYVQKGGTSSCTSKTDCASGQDCKGGVCVTPPKKCTIATAATDCSSDEQCVAGQCEPKAVVPKKFPVWAILAIVLGGLLLLGLIGYFLFGRKKTPTTATKSVPAKKSAITTPTTSTTRSTTRSTTTGTATR